MLSIEKYCNHFSPSLLTTDHFLAADSITVLNILLCILTIILLFSYSISKFPGGVTFQTYEHWKESLPDMKWLNEYLPDSEQLDSFRGVLVEMKDKVKESIDIGTVSIHYCLLTCTFIYSIMVQEGQLLVCYVINHD
jgi:hypothetical protein